MHGRRKWQPTPVFLPGESQGQGSLVGCHLWGRTESDRPKRLSSTAGLSSCSGGLRPLVELCVEPAGLCRRCTGSITNSRSSLRLMSIESVMPSSHLILCRPLLLLSPIPPNLSVCPSSFQGVSLPCDLNSLMGLRSSAFSFFFFLCEVGS